MTSLLLFLSAWSNIAQFVCLYGTMIVVGYSFAISSICASLTQSLNFACFFLFVHTVHSARHLCVAFGSCSKKRSSPLQYLHSTKSRIVKTFYFSHASQSPLKPLRSTYRPQTKPMPSSLLHHRCSASSPFPSLYQS